MSLFGSIVTFLVIWWTVIFAVMPFTVRAARGEDQPQGAMPGAPAKPQFIKIIVITTLISIVLWGIIFALSEFDVISFRRMSEALR